MSKSAGEWFAIALACLAFVLLFRGPKPPRDA